MGYVATINTPGYLPWSDEPAVFETAKEAWQFLIDERNRQWNDTEDMGPDYDPAMAEMGEKNGEDVVYASTPGYGGEHDLGLAYCVTFDPDAHPADCLYCSAGEGLVHNYEPPQNAG